MRQKIQYITLLCVALLCHVLEGVGQCSNSSTLCNGACYPSHIDIGWQCPLSKSLFGWSTNTSEWQKLLEKGFGIVGSNLDGGTPLSHTINGRTYNTKEYRINNLAALGTTIKIGCGDAMLFTDDGGTKYKYCQLPLYNSATVSDKNPLWETNINEFSNTYSFRVQSVDGVPLRFRVFEVGIRPLDILEFSEVKGDGTKEAKRAYGYGTNKPLPGSILNPTGCNGYSWCRNFKINNTPTPKDNEAGNNLAFMIESGLAEISWNVGYVKYIEDKLVSNPSFVGSVVRAGWVMVIDVLSAKVKTISLSEVAECKPDNIEVTYDVYVGAKNK
ncbi:MAG: hypothetical protein IKI28_03710, partial [Bacteroidales bacterium]|nr:hypothetical protein [Bacteroidales bacterium]